MSASGFFPPDCAAISSRLLSRHDQIGRTLFGTVL